MAIYAKYHINGMELLLAKRCNTRISKRKELGTFMPPLPVILNACATAMRRMTGEPSRDWYADYCAVVDPASVLGMAIVIKSLLDYVEAKEGSNLVTENIRSRMSDPSSLNKYNANMESA